MYRWEVPIPLFVNAIHTTVYNAVRDSNEITMYFKYSDRIN